MKPAFVPASDLKPFYSVYGHFYQVDLTPGVTAHCRSVLEIIPSDPTVSISQARLALPDAVVVMMNPGSSRFLEGTPETVPGDGEIPRPKTLVPTKPDTTQYQVMRIMQRQGWGHVRVLNLSDLREPKSPRFAALSDSLEQDHGFDGHSIFAPSRSEELESELRRKPSAPLVCAWGVAPSLDRLITLALPVLTAAGTCVGVPKPDAPGKYFHPLPTLQSQKLAWVENLCTRLGRRLSQPAHRRPAVRRTR